MKTFQNLVIIIAAAVTTAGAPLNLGPALAPGGAIVPSTADSVVVMRIQMENPTRGKDRVALILFRSPPMAFIDGQRVPVNRTMDVSADSLNVSLYPLGDEDSFVGVADPEIPDLETGQYTYWFLVYYDDGQAERIYGGTLTVTDGELEFTRRTKRSATKP